MRARSWAAPLAATAALAGCSTSINDDKAEQLATRAARSVGGRVKGAACPSGLTAKKGATFTCDVTGADGSTGKVLIVEKDDKGNAVVRSTFLRPAKLERFVLDTLAAQVTRRPITAACPDVVVAARGGRFVCHVTGRDGTKGDVQGTEKDAVGNVSIDARFLHTGTAETEIARDVERKSDVASVEVTCPAIVLPKVGATFTCQAAGGGQKATVVATQTNEQGGFRYRVEG